MRTLTVLVISALLLSLCLGCGKEPAFEAKPLSYWRTQAKDTSPKFRIEAANALGHLGDATTLADLLCDNDPLVQAAAVAALEQIGAPAVPALDNLLRTTKDRKVRASAAMLLAKTGSSAAPAAKTLVDLLGDDDPAVQAATTVALEQIGAPAVPALDKVLHANKDCKVRIIALMILAKIGPPPVSTLSNLAHEDDAEVRAAAITLLGQIGPPAVPVLAELVKNKDVKVRLAAGTALARIGPSAIPVLTALVRDRDDQVRSAAVKALGETGPATGALDGHYRSLVVGRWSDEYQGKRTMTLNDDGTGTMIVELTDWRAALSASKLTFHMKWSVEGGRLKKQTISGEPEAKVKMILSTMGDHVDEPILELTEDRLLLLDKDGKTTYDWKRVKATQ